jgi:kynurenine formamidase
MMNHYTWPRGQFLEYVQVHDDHTGTHIDAPSHMTPTLASGLPHATEHGTVTVEQLRLPDMIGEAVVVDVRSLIDGFPRGEKTNLRESPVISRAFLENWEAQNGRFSVGNIALFRMSVASDMSGLGSAWFVRFLNREIPCCRRFGWRVYWMRSSRIVRGD